MNEQDQRQRRRVRRILIVAIIIVVALALIGILSRIHKAHKLKNETQAEEVLEVTVIHPKSDPEGSDVVLPGSVHAWHEASLSARVPGYLKAWHKDIGDHVAAGDLLAEIETPETDAQLRQAEADLGLAIANNNLAQVTAKRWIALLKTDSVTKQETDEKIADAQAKAATVLSQTANRDRLQELENFKNITAPFDGIVTNRSTDIGQLISDNGGELYHIASTDDLRIYVNVPESYTSALSQNVVAELHFTEHPGQVYKAALLTTAGAIDPASRTLLAQFSMDNRVDHLFPGGYAEVHLKGPRAASSLRLPVNAFLFQSDGLQVAVVGQDKKITLKSVRPGRDFGKEIEIASGVTAQDQVVINPSDSFYDGEIVRIAPQPKENGGRQEQQAADDKEKYPDKDKDKSDSSSSSDKSNDQHGGHQSQDGGASPSSGSASGGSQGQQQGQQQNQPTAAPTTPPDNHISGGQGSSVTAQPDENSQGKNDKDDQSGGSKGQQASDKKSDAKKSNDPNNKDDAK